MIAPFDEPDDADEDEEFVVISNDYPQDLLDELARRFDGIQKNVRQSFICIATDRAAKAATVMR